MHGTSTLITIGLALGRAQSVGASVKALIGGEWVVGRVASMDGHGVVLITDQGEYGVLRLEAVKAVFIPQDLEDRPVIQDAPYARGA